MGEECGRDAPRGAPVECGLRSGSKRRVRNDHLMHPRSNVPRCEVLELLTSLYQQTASRHDHRHLAAIPKPDIQSRVPRSAMDREQIQVAVPTGEGLSHPRILREV